MNYLYRLFSKPYSSVVPESGGGSGVSRGQGIGPNTDNTTNTNNNNNYGNENDMNNTDNNNTQSQSNVSQYYQYFTPQPVPLSQQSFSSLDTSSGLPESNTPREQKASGYHDSSFDHKLPKIEYRKLVTLSLDNFTEWSESIARLGFSRMWPEEFYAPSTKFLSSYKWAEDKLISRQGWSDKRREAYIVLVNTIPKDLKYLIRKVPCGDAVGIWKTLINRFLHVTDITIRQLKNEFNDLSMKSTGLYVDEFFSHVMKKATNLRRMGVKISDHDEAVTALMGLSNDYVWIKNSYRLGMHEGSVFTFDQIEKLALDYAADHGLLKSSKRTRSEKNDSKPQPSQAKILNTKESKVKTGKHCYAYASPKGCKRVNCPFPHSKPPPSSSGSINSAEVKKCTFCGKKNHSADQCWHKAKKEKKDKETEGKSNMTNSADPEPSVPSHVTFPLMSPECVPSKSVWIFDGGSTHHITNDYSDLINCQTHSSKVFPGCQQFCTVCGSCW